MTIYINPVLLGMIIGWLSFVPIVLIAANSAKWLGNKMKAHEAKEKAKLAFRK